MIFGVPFSFIPFSADDSPGGIFNNTSLIYDSTYFVDSMRFTDSTDAVEPRWFGTAQKLSFVAGKEYTLRFKTTYAKSIISSTMPTKMDVYLVGGSFQSNIDILGTKITTLTVDSTEQYRIFSETNIAVSASLSGQSHLRFITYAGLWNVADISIESARDFEFTPSLAFISSRVKNKRLERLNFRLNLFDSNNNLFPLNVYTSPVFFNGENSFIKGTDNRMTGKVILAASGSGPILMVNPSGSYINIGTIDASLPISSSDLITYAGPPIISLYSGSTPYSGSNPQSQGVIGLQIAAGGNPSASFLDYNTLSSQLAIRGDITLLPNSALSQSIVNISGSGASSLISLQQLVNGVYSGGTYLTGNKIISPSIGGLTGYFSQSFGVGNISSGSGITLTALGYTDVTGTFRSNFPAIYIGFGQYGNTNTPFFVASSSFGSLFSLGDKVLFDASSSVLTIKGQLNVIDSGSSNQGFQDVKTVIANYIAYSPFGFYMSSL